MKEDYVVYDKQMNEVLRVSDANGFEIRDGIILFSQEGFRSAIIHRLDYGHSMIRIAAKDEDD